MGPVLALNCVTDRFCQVGGGRYVVSPAYYRFSAFDAGTICE